MKIAIFPGSFDPFTLGHLDVLSSALNVFDKVIIAVGYNHTKKGFFNPDTRVEIIKKSVQSLIDQGENIDICTYTGLTIDICKQKNVRHIIRGLRTTTDFELESVIAQANKKMEASIQTVFIPASAEYSFISSTVVRDVLVNGGDASIFFDKNVDIKQFI